MLVRLAAALLLAQFAVPHLSDGVAARGRQTFVDLRCHSCHRVAEDPSIPSPGGVWEGPLLHDLGRDTPQAVATRILVRARVSPDAPYRKPMAQVGGAMSDAQLADIVAYLRSPRSAR